MPIVKVSTTVHMKEGKFRYVIKEKKIPTFLLIKQNFPLDWSQK